MNRIIRELEGMARNRPEHDKGQIFDFQHGSERERERDRERDRER